MNQGARLKAETHHAADLMEARARDEATYPIWRVFTAIMLMGMQLAWMVPLYQLFTRLTAPVPFYQPYLLFGAVMLGSFLVNLILLTLKLRTGPTRMVLVTLVAAGVLVCLKLLVFRYIPMTFQNVFGRSLETVPDISGLVRPEIMVALTVVLAWQRGVALSLEQVGPQLVLRHFRTGVAALLLFALLTPRETEGAVFSIGLFLLCGLLAMAGARFSFLGQLRGGRPFAFEPVWVLGLGGAGIVILALVAGFGRAAGGTVMNLIADAAGRLWRLISIGLLQLIEPFILRLAGYWEDVIGWFRDMTLDEASGNLLLDDSANPAGEIVELMERPAWIDNAAAAFRLVAIVAVVVIAIIVTLRLLRYYRKRTHNGMDEERESIFSAGDLRSLLDSLLRRSDELQQAVRLSTRQRRRAAERIRQIYADLLQLGQEVDVARPKACTPKEYLPYLEQRLKGCGDSLAALTDAYQRVRYGELPETSEDVRRVEEAWDHIAEAGRALKREMRSMQRRVRTNNEDWKGL